MIPDLIKLPSYCREKRKKQSKIEKSNRKQKKWLNYRCAPGIKKGQNFTETLGVHTWWGLTDVNGDLDTNRTSLGQDGVCCTILNSERLIFCRGLGVEPRIFKCSLIFSSFLFVFWAFSVLFFIVAVVACLFAFNFETVSVSHLGLNQYPSESDSLSTGERSHG